MENVLIHHGYESDKKEIQKRLGLRYMQGIYDEIHTTGMAYIAMVVGRHRAGKSLFTTAASCMLDYKFIDNMHTNIVYDSEQFMNCLMKINKEKRKGACIIWDEAGVGMPARDWHSISNKSISYALQVLGYLNPIIFFVTQDISYLDSNARKLLNAFYDMRRSTTSHSIAKVYDVKHVRITGKTYMKRPKMRLNNAGYTLDGIIVPKPPEEIIKKYIERSEPFKDYILKQMSERTAPEEAPTEYKDRLTMDQILSEVVKNHATFEPSTSKPEKIKISKDLIMFEYKSHGLTFREATGIKQKAEKILNKKVKENGE